MPYALTINGESRTLDLPPETMLIDALRDALGLKGATVGCDTCQCGCCTVLVDGDAVKACTMLAAQVEGTRIVTIEGLAVGDRLHPLQQAFHQRHALQCGYCTPGFIMSAVELIEKYDDLDEAKVRHLIEGNICRCTGYENIVDAILDVAASKGAAA